MTRRKPPPATHCKRGHEFNAENTYTNPHTGRRRCRKCKQGGVSKNSPDVEPLAFDAVTAEKQLAKTVEDENLPAYLKPAERRMW